jgi:hypothetical protein
LPIAPVYPDYRLGSLLTYGRRHSLQSLLCLAAVDDDGAAATETSSRQPRPPARSRPAAAAAPPAAATSRSVPSKRSDHTPLTDPQRRRMFAAAKECSWQTDELKKHLYEKFGVDTTSDLRAGDFDEVLRIIHRGPSTATSAAGQDPADGRTEGPIP